jgi:hypothetical protein
VGVGLFYYKLLTPLGFSNNVPSALCRGPFWPSIFDRTKHEGHQL